MQSVYIQDKPNYLKKVFVFFSYLLVIVLVIGIGYVYLPLVDQPTDTIHLPMNTPTVSIPKIHATSPVFINMDTNNARLQSYLTKGLVHVKGSAIPGEAGTSFLIAQTDGLPWEVTRQNASFLRLNQLDIKDEIILSKAGATTTYLVWMKKEVWPDQVNGIISTVQDNSQTNHLIIQADTPIGTSFKRILIFAAPK